MNTSIFYPVIAIVGAVVSGLLMLALLNVLMPLVIRYKLAEEGIEVHFFGNLAVWKIEYRSVESLRKVHCRILLRQIGIGPMEGIPTVLRLANRVVGDGVFIRRKSGLFRKIVITPEFPDEFVMSASARLPPHHLATAPTATAHSRVSLPPGTLATVQHPGRLDFGRRPPRPGDFGTAGLGVRGGEPVNHFTAPRFAQVEACLQEARRHLMVTFENVVATTILAGGLWLVFLGWLHSRRSRPGS